MQFYMPTELITGERCVSMRRSWPVMESAA